MQIHMHVSAGVPASNNKENSKDKLFILYNYFIIQFFLSLFYVKLLSILLL